MKIVQKERDVSVVSLETTSFGISDSAKMFHILVRNLYSNVIQSVVRELCTNAFDAHIVAGKVDTPFDVSLPTPLDPMFRIRDYGCSMDHDMICKTYAMLGVSTKDTTNEQAGALGLGAKSPFAYTDMFTLTAYDGKRARYYSAALSSENKPQIHLMGEEESDEPRGIEVTFPTTTSDRKAFTEAAEFVFAGFDVKPICNITIKNKVEKPVLIGDGWKLFEPDYGFCGVLARMGPVLYPVDKLQVAGLSSEAEKLFQVTTIVDFPIGSLNFTPSRETLSYGKYDNTVTVVRDRLNEVAEQVITTISAFTDECTSEYEAVLKKKKWEKECDSVSQVFSPYITWKGKTVQQYVSIGSDVMGELRQTHYELTFKHVRPYDNKVVKYNGDVLYRNSSVYIDTDGLVVVLEDGNKTKNTAARIQALRDTTGRKSILWFRIWDTKATVSHVHKIMEVFNGADFYIADELPSPIKKPRESQRGAPKKRAKVRIAHVTKKGSVSFLNTENSDAQLEKGGVYVTLGVDNKINSLLPSVDNFKSSSAYKVFHELKKLGLPDQYAACDVVCAVAATNESKLDASKWIRLDVLAADMVSATDTTALIEAWHAISLVDNIYNAPKICRWANECLSEGITPMSSSSPFSEIMRVVSEKNKVESVYGSAYVVERNLRLVEHLSGQTPAVLDNSKNKYHGLVTLCNQAYPLLAKMFTYDAYATDVLKYIDLMDADAASKALNP